MQDRALGNDDDSILDSPAPRVDFSSTREGSDDYPLGQNGNVVDVGIDTVADRDIDQPVFTGDRDGRLGALPGEWIQTLAYAPAEDHRGMSFVVGIDFPS